MSSLSYVLVFMFALMLVSVQAAAQNEVVPAHEHVIANKLGVDGPKETKGVESVKDLGHVSLADERMTLSDRVMRAREITIAPGGVVAVHQHEARPGVAYILEGEIMEFRNDEPQALLRKTGAVSFEKTGVIHWWENQSSERVRALIVDLVTLTP